jgi:ATP-dependent RNA helicase RhlE
VDIVSKSLKKYGYDAAPIHGDLDQSQRNRTLDDFREGKIKFLVASDVAARGLDVPSVTHVFNYDVPGHAEDYVHRIGRTGRAGRDGKAIMICEPRDEKNFKAIEDLIQKAIPRVDNPLAGQPEEEPREAKAPAPRERDDNQRSSSRSRSNSRGRKKGGSPADLVGESNRGKGIIVGMGDHMPSFIAMSFEERRAAGC